MCTFTFWGPRVSLHAQPSGLDRMMEGSHNPNATPTTKEILERNEFPLGFKNNNKSWRRGNTLTLSSI